MKSLKNRATTVIVRFSTLTIYLLAVLTGLKTALADNRGEGYVDTGLKILISVVIGALLLAGLYTLFGNTILPTLTKKIQDLFNYAG